MEEAHIVVDVQPSPLSESMQHKLKTLWGNTTEAKNCTIFRTPHIISQSRKKLFEPTVISIGPFHRDKEYLRGMEPQKWLFLRDFLSRGRGDNISLDLCISEMKNLETRTRRCYSETFDDLDSDTFVEMMLLDGCFVLEYFLKFYKRNAADSVFEVGWSHNFIKYDLVLQENQIPFFIVEKLYELVGFNQVLHRMFFVKFLAFRWLHKESIFRDLPAETPDTVDPTDSIDPLAEILANIPDPPAEIHHLLHLCYHYLVPNPEKPVVLSSKSFDLTRMFSANRTINGLLQRFGSRVLTGRSPHSTSQSLSVALLNSTGNLSSMVIPSATELKQKGVKFTPKIKPKMLDISFEYGVLKIPSLKITDGTKPLFTNLLAFEHSKYGKKHSPFGRFVQFLDNLINTPNDVTILQQCGIIENSLGSEEELAHFINQVGEGTFFGTDHYLAELYTEVNRYIGSSWHRNRAKLIRDYFSSPWAVISLVACFDTSSSYMYTNFLCSFPELMML